MTSYYQITHLTRFVYDSAVRESVMEVRMRPRDESHQSCLQFELQVSPRARLWSYRDYLGNHVHHFDIPATHIRETITAEAVVRVDEANPLPDRLAPEAWDQYPAMVDDSDVWDMTQPSRFARPTDLLHTFAESVGITRQADPLTMVHHLGSAVHHALDYQTDSTHVDSPIDDALAARAGVCQDYAHVMIALCRVHGLPARYVSGYLYTPPEARRERGEAAAATDATHAWVEVMLPELGWVGYDPTHDAVVRERHIRTAVGRDYADVPPTRGVYRGQTESHVEVEVSVVKLDRPPSHLARTFDLTGWTPPEPPQDVPDEPKPFAYYAQQMQQQQNTLR